MPMHWSALWFLGIFSAFGAEETSQQIAASLPNPGPCVPIPNDRWRIMVRVDTNRMTRWGFSTLETIDLDGDGQEDSLVPIVPAPRPELRCPTEVQYDLYLNRDSCGILVGRIEGQIQAGGTESSHHGLRDLQTSVDVMSPAEQRRTLHYQFDGSTYVRVSEDRHTSRCRVHPAACYDLTHHRCELRDHPTHVSVFDSDAGIQRLHEAMAEARQCNGPADDKLRCRIWATFGRDGHVSDLEISQCNTPPLGACVEKAFRGVTVPPFVGDPQSQGISFQFIEP